jgi:hypothetical protein
MEVWCGTSPQDLGTAQPDVVVLPEDVTMAEIEAAAERLPRAIVVGAVREGHRMRGVLWHTGRNCVDYLKVGCDGHTIGGDPPADLPILTIGDLSVGVLICLDVDPPTLRRDLVEALRAAPSQFKIVCVPAEMQAGLFFADGWVSPMWAGVVLAVSNGISRYPTSRLASFIAGADGQKIALQQDREPVRFQLT